MAAQRLEADKQLRRMTALDVRDLTALRARNRLRQMRALLKFLNRTDHAAVDDVPGHDERERLMGPALAALEKLAKRARPARRAHTTPTPKETPMPTTRCLIDGHPHHPGSGCVIDDPHAKPPAPPANGPAAPGFPLGLMPYIHACEGIFAVPNFDQVRRQRALDLARIALDYAPHDREALVAALFYRFLMRAARGGAA